MEMLIKGILIERVYKIDAYGYGHDVTIEDLEDIKQQILDIIEDLEKEEV